MVEYATKDGLIILVVYKKKKVSIIELISNGYISMTIWVNEWLLFNGNQVSIFFQLQYGAKSIATNMAVAFWTIFSRRFCIPEMSLFTGDYRN